MLAAEVTYQGVTCLTDYTSATQVDCDFSANGGTGIPYGDAAAASLKFRIKTTSVEYSTARASILLAARNSAETIANTMPTTATIADPNANGNASSYAGGYKVEITSAVGVGFTPNLGVTGNTVTLCGNPCPISADDSDATKTVCIAPALATTMSNTEFKIAEAAMLSLTWTGTGDATELAKLSNGKNTDEYVDTTALCEVKTTFKTGQVGMIDEVGFFLNRLYTTTDKAKINGKVVFEGSDDGTAWTTLASPADEIHEGWNAYRWDGTTGNE